MFQADGRRIPHLRKASDVGRKLTNDNTTMKLLTIILLLIFNIDLFAQNKIIGSYRDHLGSHVQLNMDNTFKYTWNFDMAVSWTKGTWKLNGDTICFHMIPIYDTLNQTNYKGIVSDTLILSDDEISARITPIQYAAIVLSSGGQNRIPYTDKLFFKKGRLYKIQNGKLVIQKQTSFLKRLNGSCLIKRWDPWFFRVYN